MVTPLAPHLVTAWVQHRASVSQRANVCNGWKVDATGRRRSQRNIDPRSVTDRPMTTSPNPAKLIAALAMAAASCMFALVVASAWARHVLPSSENTLFLSLGGMIAVGCLFGFAVSALANIVLRAGSAKLRLPLSALAWPAFCGAGYVWLTHSGADPARSAILAVIAGVCGVICGVPYAEIVVGSWFLKRVIAGRDRKLAEIERDHQCRLEEIRLQAQACQKAAQDSRLEEQERPQAIRNYLRS